MGLCLDDGAQQSVHLIGGILRHFRTLLLLRVYTPLRLLYTPPLAGNAHGWAANHDIKILFWVKSLER